MVLAACVHAKQSDLRLCTSGNGAQKKYQIAIKDISYICKRTCPLRHCRPTSLHAKDHLSELQHTVTAAEKLVLAFRHLLR